MRVRWGNSRWCSRGRCSEEGLYELEVHRGWIDRIQGGLVQRGGYSGRGNRPLDYKGEGSGVGVVAEKHGGGGLGEAVLGEEGDKTKL